MNVKTFSVVCPGTKYSRRRTLAIAVPMMSDVAGVPLYIWFKTTARRA